MKIRKISQLFPLKDRASLTLLWLWFNFSYSRLPLEDSGVLFFFNVRGCVESSDSFTYLPFCWQFNLFFNIHRFGLCKIIIVYHSRLCKPFLYVWDCVIFLFIIHRSGLSKFLFMGRDCVNFYYLLFWNFFSLPGRFN